MRLSFASSMLHLVWRSCLWTPQCNEFGDPAIGPAFLFRWLHKAVVFAWTENSEPVLEKKEAGYSSQDECRSPMNFRDPLSHPQG